MPQEGFIDRKETETIWKEGGGRVQYATPYDQQVTASSVACSIVEHVSRFGEMAWSNNTARGNLACALHGYSTIPRYAPETRSPTNLRSFKQVSCTSRNARWEVRSSDDTN
jgi:hypothetical protein